MADPNLIASDAMEAFLEGARRLSQCRMAVALWQRTPDEVVPLCSVPSIQLSHTPVWRWRLPDPQSLTQGSELDAFHHLSRQQLPSLVTAGLTFSPGAVVYVDCSSLGRISTGGFVLLWEENKSSSQNLEKSALAVDRAELLWLRPVYAQLLDVRQWESRTAESIAQFHHVFDSVPHGIVVSAVRSAEAQVNDVAADLFGLPSGTVPADELAKAMRETRERCNNAAVLEEAYLPLQSDLEAKLVVDWHLNESVWRVDTHPMLQNGYKGRVWLFQDITAQVRLERVLRMEANLDPLTGLFNRRAFLDRAQVALQSSTSPMDDDVEPALVIFDIDHFKRINDSYGHPVGDQVLKEVARRAKAALRDGDVLARYGGEEFIALLNTAPREAAQAAARRLRLAICTEPVQVKDQLINVTVSIGLSFAAIGQETLQQALERADDHLYRAKRSGRNRIASDDD